MKLNALKSRVEELEKRLSWMENNYNNELEFRWIKDRLDYRFS